MITLIRKFFKKKKSNFQIDQSEIVLHEKYRILQRKLRSLKKQYRSSSKSEKKELREEIKSTEEKLESAFYEKHLYADGFRRSDLSHYYKHIRLARPISIILNIFLWGALLWMGNISSVVKLLIIIFAVPSTIGSIVELSFLLKIKNRILVPVEALEKGVEEIADGNFNVEVKMEKPNEISNLINAFNNMAKKLKEDEKLKEAYEENRKDLIANISHDLKTPITSIQGYVEALLEPETLTEEKKANYLKIISNNTGYLNRLIDDLFLFSRLDIQKLDFHFVKTSIKPFLQDMMEEFNLDLSERNVSFEYRDELDKDYYTNIDARRFHQVIYNIISNAVKYGQSNSLVIRTRLYLQGDNFCIDIADNGPGIPQEKLQHIFERFYRVDTERTKDFSSTGLGLAIAKELIEAHDGHISVTSEVSKGTCFTIDLPVLQ